MTVAVVMVVLFGFVVQVDEKIVKTLKAILRKNIHKVGHLYARFVTF